MATYQDKKGTTFATREEAKASNLGVPVPAPTTAPTTASTAITSNALKPVTPATLATPPPATEMAGLQGEIEAETDAFNANLAEQKKTAEANLKTAKDPLSEYIKGLQGQTGLEDKAYSQAGGVDTIQTELNDINAQINAEQLSQRRKTEAVLAQGGQSKGQAQSMINNINRESIAKQADLSVIQMARQGRYDSAKAIADRAVSAKLEEQKTKLEAAKFNYEENKDLFTLAEQRQFDSLVADRTRKLETEEANLKQISDFSIEALKAGAPTSVASAIRGAKTMDEAIALGGSYLRPKPVAPSAPKAPDLQNFGTATEPNWKQFNPETGSWEEVSGLDGMGSGMVDAQKVSESQNKLDTLLGYSNQALELSGAAGASGLSKMVGNLLVGDTKFNRLSNVTDTLKTNLLTLNTDPAIKKFFGPQMSNRDTELMVSAGSTLNAEKQSPADLKKEVEDYQDFLKRAKGWTTLGTGSVLQVKLIDPATGKSQDAVVNYDTLSQAIRDGVQVKF